MLLLSLCARAHSATCSPGTSHVPCGLWPLVLVCSYLSTTHSLLSRRSAFCHSLCALGRVRLRAWVPTSQREGHSQWSSRTGTETHTVQKMHSDSLCKHTIQRDGRTIPVRPSLRLMSCYMRCYCRRIHWYSYIAFRTFCASSNTIHQLVQLKRLILPDRSFNMSMWITILSLWASIFVLAGKFLLGPPMPLSSSLFQKTQKTYAYNTFQWAICCFYCGLVLVFSNRVTFTSKNRVISWELVYLYFVRRKRAALWATHPLLSSHLHYNALFSIVRIHPAECHVLITSFISSELKQKLSAYSELITRWLSRT